MAIPGYTGSASESMRCTLAKLYLGKHRAMRAEIVEVSNVSIAIDLRPSARCNHYLCIPIHWLDANFNLGEKTSSFCKFKGRHLASRIRTHMKSVSVANDLTSKIAATTTDNESNVKAASTEARILGVRFHLLVHTLNLTIHNG